MRNPALRSNCSFKSKAEIEKFVDECGLLSSEPFIHCKDCVGGFAQLKEQIVLAQSQSGFALLGNCVAQTNSIVRQFNRIPGAVLKISRVAASDAEVLWKFIGGKYTIISLKIGDEKVTSADAIESWCQRLSLDFGALSVLIKHLFNEKIPFAPSTPSIPILGESKVITDTNINFLQYCSIASSLCGNSCDLWGPDISVGPSLKRRRVSQDDGHGILLYSQYGNSSMALTDRTGVRWVDSVLDSCTNSMLECKTLLRCNQDVLSVLIVCVNIGEGGESLLHLACDQCGVPIKVLCYRKSNVLLPIGCEHKMTEDYSTFAILLDLLVKQQQAMCGSSKFRGNDSVGSFSHQSAVVELLRAWFRAITEG